MGRKKLTDGRDPNIPLICAVCGDKPRGNNFSVLSCVSCKSFFRRYGLLNLKDLQCKYRRKCIITVETRNDCLPCRLRKSLDCGMDPKMIRSPPTKQHYSMKTKQLQTIIMRLHSPTPKPLNLLRNDSSTLTNGQWNLLSNMIRSYDEQNVINRFNYLVSEKSSLPPKLRLKPADTLDLMSQTLKDILPLMEHSPHFLSLSSHANRAVILHNLYFTGGLNGYFVARETNAFGNITCVSGSSMLLGSDYMAGCARDNERLVANGNLYKLMLFVMIFSSNCSIVMFNNEENLRTMSSTIELIHTQDIYVTILWKYLVYLYGYDGAAIQFSSIVKNILDMFIRTEEILKSLAFHTLVDRIVTQTDHSLVITD